MKKKEISESDIHWLVKNWDKIPDNFKSDIHGHGYGSSTADVKDLKKEEHIVVLLLDRQKPSVSPSYDFNEERIGVTRTGKIIWGFDSGCSCPSPWSDSYPDCYKVEKSWKEFEVKLKSFDTGVLEECKEVINKIREKV